MEQEKEKLNGCFEICQSCKKRPLLRKRNGKVEFYGCFYRSTYRKVYLNHYWNCRPLITQIYALSDKGTFINPMNEYPEMFKGEDSGRPTEDLTVTEDEFYRILPIEEYKSCCYHAEMLMQKWSTEKE